MNRFYFYLVVFFSIIFPCLFISAQPVVISKKYNTVNACDKCKITAGFTKFFDDGGESGVISNKYSVTTFIAEPGYILSLYFLDIDLPNGAKINVYNGESISENNLVKSFRLIEKTRNIVGEILTIEYVPPKEPYTGNYEGWHAQLDRLLPAPSGIDQDVQSPPESDCPYAIPLCQNNTAVALGGQYTDLGSIDDDAGSCYSGTGSGGSVWYTFTPQSNGPIDFTINPTGSTDYDFVLWDITNGCQSNRRTELACNFSLYTGITGLNSTLCTENYGSCTSNDCSNQSKGSDCNRFNNRVNVTVGRQYAICVNFYSGSNDGFLLEFKKQSTSVAITDNTPPTVTNAYSGNCPSASSFRINFSEWVTCSSIQNTDFTLAGRTFTIVNTNCVNGRTNNIDISVSPALTSGSYNIQVQNITDLCGNNMNSSFNVNIGAPPVGTISTPQLVCKSPGLFGGYNYSPGSQTITATGGTSYIWSDGQTGASASFSATSTRTVSVTIINGGCSSTLSTTINVDYVSVNLGPDQLYCGTPIVLTATPAIPGATYTFYRNPVFFPPSNGTQFQTGTSNTTSVSPGGYTTYRVVVTSPNGCKASDDMSVTVTPPANATISLNGNNFCLNANPLVLTATPIGGVFTGPGISNDTFYPARAGVGTHVITYSVTNGCGTFTNTRNITVSNGTLPTTTLAPSYCVTDANVNLDANPRCGTFAGTGITSAGACFFGNWIINPVFSPSTAGVGIHTITYSGAGCANTFKVNVLGAGGAPTISGAGGPYCTSSPTITLTGSPVGGTFSGPGMSGNVFNPATAGVGTHSITYTVFACGNILNNTVTIQVVSSAATATINYTPNTFCNSITTPQNVTRTGVAGGTYTASPAGLTINASTGAITPSTSTLGTYTVTYSLPAAGGCPAFSTSASVTISSGITPTFSAIGPYCQNAVPVTLPVTSQNSINGTWSPASISTNTPGTTAYTFTPSAGQCASGTSVNVIVKPVVTANISQSICQGSSISFNGNTISTAGVFRDTLTTTLGCDSFIVLTITLKPVATTNLLQSICQGSSISFNGNTITTAGVYRDTLSTSLGCDSFLVLTVTIKPVVTTNLTQSICQGSSIIFNGNTITNAGVYRDTLTTSLGCDSFIVLTLAVNTAPSTNLSQSICQGRSIVFNGNTITTAGTYRDTLPTSSGCDSIIILTINVNPAPTTNISQSICQGRSIVFNGNTITTAGVYRDTLSTSSGCDSILILTVVVIPSSITNLSQSICQGNSIVFNGNTITTSGVYRDTLTNSLGCDSFIVLTLNVNPEPISNLTQNICQGSSIVFNGNTISTAGVFRDTLVTSLGCDSFIVMSVTVNPTPTTNITQSICQGSSISFNGNIISAAGLYRDTLSTSLGCDSFIVLTVTIKPVASTNLSQSICQGSSLVFNGNTITAAGVYRDTLSTSLGCDSFIVLTITVKPIATTNIAQSICQGSSILFNGNTISTVGVYRDTLNTSLGCDSFIVLTVTVKPVVSTNITQSICQGSSILFNGNAITTAGVYRDTLTTSLGCDSFIVLTISIKPVVTTSLSQSICQGSSILFNGNAISSAGVYRDTLSTSLGCDSFLVLTVSVNQEPTTNLIRNICQGSSTLFNGSTINTAGVYRDTLTTSLGCDSFLVLTVFVNATPTTNITQNICPGGSVFFNGNSITTPGVYRDTLLTTAGCDSFVVMTVSLFNGPTTNISRSICQGSSITFNGNVITSPGVYRDTLQTVQGCDSFIVLSVTVNNVPTFNLLQSICQGSSLVFNGNVITTAGIYRDTLRTSFGCDSFLILTVSVYPTPLTNLTRSICQGQSVLFNGISITSAGSYRDTLSTSLGCDSFLVLTVQVNNVPTTNISRSICQGSSTTFNGNVITSAGVFRDTLQTSLGCDSFIVLTLSVRNVPTTTLTRSICQGSTTIFNGNAIMAAGVYRDTLQTTQGCDSFLVLTVNVNNLSTTNITRVICQGSSTVFNGNTIGTSGVYRDTLHNSSGCDSFVVLTLTVNPVPTTNISRTICQGSSTNFNGNILNTAGVYKDTLITSLGCDSFLVLTLNVNPVIRSSQSPVICQGSSVSVGSHTYTATGFYTDTLRSSRGCDSIVQTNLTVQPNYTQSVTIVSDTNRICPGQSVSFTANAQQTGNNLSYQWFVNGNPVATNSAVFSSSTLANGDVVTAGIRSSGLCLQNPVALSNALRMEVSSVNFRIPVIEYCNGESAIADINVNPPQAYSVTWRNGNAVSTTLNADSIQISNTASGNVSFTVNYGNGCTKSGNIPVTVNPLPIINAISNVPRVRYQQEVQLDVSHNGQLSYNWSPADLVSNTGIRNPTSVITSTTVFQVEVTDGKNCRNSDTVTVELIDECHNEFIYMPTAFSPNRDNVNDCFGILQPPVLSDFKLVIYDRWSETVFESKAPDYCWDGTFKGVDALTDSYVYIVSFTCYNGKVLTKKGTVTLLR